MIKEIKFDKIKYNEKLLKLKTFQPVPLKKEN